MQEIFILMPFSEWHWRKYKSLLSIFCHVFAKHPAAAAPNRTMTTMKTNHPTKWTNEQWRTHKEGKENTDNAKLHTKSKSCRWRSCSSIKHRSSFYCTKIVCDNFVYARAGLGLDYGLANSDFKRNGARVPFSFRFIFISLLLLARRWWWWRRCANAQVMINVKMMECVRFA